MGFRNSNSNTCTRFVGLGNFLDKVSKQKWLYGFVLSPTEPKRIDFTVTDTPYATNPSDYIANMMPASTQYFYNTNTKSHHENGPSKKKKYVAQNRRESILIHNFISETKSNNPKFFFFFTALEIDTESCWFCLSSKNITKHMIVSIGDQVY